MSLTSRIVTAALAFAIALPAAGNDTMVTLGAGGLVPSKSSEIVMESENLQISIHEIMVSYVFRNTSDHDVDAVVAFPLPDLDGGVVENEPIRLPSKDPANFVSLNVIVEGQTVEPSVEIRAFKNGQDITTRLGSLGLPLSVLDPKIGPAFAALPQEQQRKLERDELIVTEDIHLNGRKPETIHWPFWDTRIRYFWRQRFPASGTIHVVHTYRPVVGGGYVTESMNGPSNAGLYCVGPQALSQIKELKARVPKNRSEVALLESAIQYILTTGNNWRGPIRDFHLTVVADHADDIVLTCMSGLERVSPTKYELTRTNFHPESELELLILQPNR